MALPFSLRSLLTGQSGSPPTGDAEPPWPERPDGRVIWLECGGSADLGAARALAARLGHLGVKATAIATIPGAAQCVQEPTLIIAPAPPTHSAEVHRFLDHWQPDVFVCLTGDPDPANVTLIEKTDARLILANVTAEAAGKHKRGWLTRMTRSIYDHFDTVMATDDRAAEVLRNTAGVRLRGLEVTGPLQDGARVLPHNERERADIAAALQTRPVWCVASATKDEIAAIAAAHRYASRRSHRLLLVVIPRTLEDAPELAAAIQEKGIMVAMRSDGAEPTDALQAYVADLGGETGLWYRIAPITFLGGSISGGGCDDPFEPAALGSATIHGPETAPFQPHFSRLDGAGGSIAIPTADDLGRAVEACLSPDRAAAISHAAWDVTSTGSEATERVVGLIAETFEREDR